MEKQISNFELGHLKKGSNIALPQTDFPSFQNPIQFFKVRERLTQNYDTFRLGFQAIQFSRYQQDYICHLTQCLACECQFLKIFLIQPNYLYIEMSIMRDMRSAGSQGIQVLENNICEVLQFAKRVVREFVQEFLSQEGVMSQNFSYERLMEAFRKNVIQKINNKYKASLIRNI